MRRGTEMVWLHRHRVVIESATLLLTALFGSMPHQLWSLAVEFKVVGMNGHGGLALPSFIQVGLQILFGDTLRFKGPRGPHEEQGPLHGHVAFWRPKSGRGTDDGILFLG
eukprot:TRINITY_DN26979_c0_g1_i1.p1 TRINITY_DN26979_c0_g1~~TRINITY_DN26979_c0_g1_i1.p1  ORF type:complete len:110 (+),score=10.69 TRINITY_DN26979_c0_g1_i1:104-433(+)